jgi:hypothetical protein
LNSNSFAPQTDKNYVYKKGSSKNLRQGKAHWEKQGIKLLIVSLLYEGSAKGDIFGFLELAKNIFDNRKKNGYY